MITAREICRITGKKEAAVSLFISRNGIKPRMVSGRCKYYDGDAEPLRSYVAGDRRAASAPKPEPPKEASCAGDAAGEAGRRAKAAARGDRKAAARSAPDASASSITPVGDYFSGKTDGASPDAKILSRAYSDAERAGNFEAMIKIAATIAKERDSETLRTYAKELHEAKMRRAQAEAQKAALENGIRRGEFVARDAMTRGWSNACAVITSRIHPIGTKLSGQLYAAAHEDGRDGAVLKIQEMIDGEVFAALESVRKALMVD